MVAWRVQYFREGSPYPVSRYHHGDQAEKEAKAEAAELRDRGVTNVEVKRIEKGSKP
ncbi:MAG: hypothetical protein ACLFWH_05260 [Actinomycetota bacterium]